jgi:hypothetical protein
MMGGGKKKILETNPGLSAGAMTNQEAVVLLAVKVTGGMSCR